jgi:phosphoglycolate phosphatase-like HAD superfamily hydrolase
VTVPGVVLEIEETLFDTGALRAGALHRALADEGVTVPLALVIEAHAGATAAMALAQLTYAQLSDVVVRDLVLQRAADTMRANLSQELPSFHSASRDALEQLATEVPLAVVTRAERGDTDRMLEAAGLTASVRVVRSLGDLPLSEHHTIWRDVAARLHVTRAVAAAPSPLLPAAHQAGLVTIAIGTGGGANVKTLVSVSQLNTSFLSTLL